MLYASSYENKLPELYRSIIYSIDMRFSIIIPTYNSSNYLPDCLNSLFLQDYPKDEYEIILVDDASTENIEEVSSMVLDSYIRNNQNISPPLNQVRFCA